MDTRRHSSEYILGIEPDLMKKLLSSYDAFLVYMELRGVNTKKNFIRVGIINDKIKIYGFEKRHDREVNLADVFVYSEVFRKLKVKPGSNSDFRKLIGNP